MSRRRHNLKWWIGLCASVAAAIAGQAHLLPEPYGHWIGMGCTVLAVLNSYMIRRPPLPPQLPEAVYRRLLRRDTW